MKEGTNYMDRNEIERQVEAGYSADQISNNLKIRLDIVEAHIATLTGVVEADED